MKDIGVAADNESYGKGLDQDQSNPLIAACNIAPGLKQATTVAGGVRPVSVSGSRAANDVRACLYMRVRFCGIVLVCYGSVRARVSHAYLSRVCMLHKPHIHPRLTKTLEYRVHMCGASLCSRIFSMGVLLYDKTP